MIVVDLPAHLECVEKNCEARLSIKLGLSAGGTYLPRAPVGHGWQMEVIMTGAILCRCPKHHSVIEKVGPH